jgi:hypothetical protein
MGMTDRPPWPGGQREGGEGVGGGGSGRNAEGGVERKRIDGRLEACATALGWLVCGAWTGGRPGGREGAAFCPDAGQRISRVATVISSSSAAVMSRASSFMASLRGRAVRQGARPARSCAVSYAGGGWSIRHTVSATPCRAALFRGAPRGASGALRHAPGHPVSATEDRDASSAPWAWSTPARPGRPARARSCSLRSSLVMRRRSDPAKRRATTRPEPMEQARVMTWFSVGCDVAGALVPPGMVTGGAAAGRWAWGGTCERERPYRAAATRPAQAETSSRMVRGSPSIFSESATMSAPRPDRRSSMASTAPQK